MHTYMLLLLLLRFCCIRSGWQPPKDTGLWLISARVKAQIEAQMTPAQQEYWQAEGGYFEQVRWLLGALHLQC